MGFMQKAYHAARKTVKPYFNAYGLGGVRKSWDTRDTWDTESREAIVLTVEQVTIGQLKPNPRNPRVNDEAVDAVARSIQAYGFNNPIITDSDLNVAAGHTRLKAARKLGLETVPVIRVPGLVGSKFTGYSIADNRVGEIAEWNQDLLAQLVSELNRLESPRPWVHQHMRAPLGSHRTGSIDHRGVHNAQPKT
jgi:hypothetical protein